MSHLYGLCKKCLITTLTFGVTFVIDNTLYWLSFKGESERMSDAIEQEAYSLLKSENQEDWKAGLALARAKQVELGYVDQILKRLLKWRRTFPKALREYWQEVLDNTGELTKDDLFLGTLQHLHLHKWLTWGEYREMEIWEVPYDAERAYVNTIDSFPALQTHERHYSLSGSLDNSHYINKGMRKRAIQYDKLALDPGTFINEVNKGIFSWVSGPMPKDGYIETVNFEYQQQLQEGGYELIWGWTANKDISETQHKVAGFFGRFNS